MKRKSSNLKNSTKYGNRFREIIVHIILLCLMVMLEAMAILKMRVMPENAYKVTMLVFLTAATAPAAAHRNNMDIYGIIGYYMGVLLIWATIGVGYFDCEIKCMKQFVLCTLASITILFAMRFIFNRNTPGKYKRK